MGSILLDEAERVFRLIDEERHLAALAVLEKVQERLSELEQRLSSSSSKRGWKNRKSKGELSDKKRVRKEFDNVRCYLSQRASTISTLQSRCKLFREAINNVNQTEQWTEASNHFGVRTFYRRENDNSLSVKLEGELTGAPLFEQICVLREFDLHYKWSPCCTSSQTIANLDKLDTVGWFLVGLPSYGLARDACVRVIGCDSTLEDGKVILSGQGIRDIMPGAALPTDTFLVDDPVIDTLNIPSAPNRRGAGRMTIRKFQAIIDVKSPTSATTNIVANIDPNISLLPNWLLEFAMKNIAGVILWKMQGAARRVVQNPQSSPHARRMRQDENFYKSFLLPKCQSLCASRGWEMTPVHYFDPLPTERSEQRPTNPTMVDGYKSASSLDGASTVLLSTRSADGLLEEGDNMSELSKDSAIRQLVRNNVIVKFLRKEEQKTKLRKAHKYTEMAQRSADRLRARVLSNEEELRFAALQHTKAARSVTNSSLSQRFSLSLNQHSTRTRVVVMTCLMVTFLTALYPARAFHAVGWDDAPWRRFLSTDTEALLCILFCAAPHFLLCDVALIYAFDGLELGAKTGQTVKAFYSDTVRFVMALLSVGIAGFSVSQAAAKVVGRSFMLQLSQIEAVSTGRSVLIWKNLNAILTRLIGDSGEPESWTIDAFQVARNLFFYTSFFLVAVLVLFYLSLPGRPNMQPMPSITTSPDFQRSPISPNSSSSSSIASVISE